MTCPIPFFVWFHHRSGSSHLCSLLDSHSEIASWGEFFYRGEAGAAGDIFTRSGSQSESEFLDHLYSYRWNSRGAYLCVNDPEPPLARAVGFKLKYQQNATYPGVMSYLRQQPQMKAIHLVRTNLLSALISAAMIPRLLKQFQRPNLLASESPQQVERTVRLDPQTVHAELEMLESRIERGREALDGFEVLELRYEDLLDAQAVTCRKVLDFLEVDGSINLASRYVKIMPRSIEESLENVNEVAKALQGSRFASFLQTREAA